MNSIVNIDIQHAATNTTHVAQIGICSYNIAPINSNWLPKAVAPNQHPCIIPWYWGGATFDTKDIPSGLINNSAIVRIK